jgi:regulatory protein
VVVSFRDPGSNNDSERSEGDTLAPVTYLPGVARNSGAEVADDDGFAEAVVDPEAVESQLVRKLARRSLSETEALEFAVQEGLTAAQANTILDHLRELGYVDDRALAEQLKHSLSERKGQSKAVVARAMSARSIDRDIINEVLEDIEQEDELTVATELARKRASQMSGLDRQTLERRLTGFLARRGYPGNIVREAIAPVLTGCSSAPASTVRFR